MLNYLLGRELTDNKALQMTLLAPDLFGSNQMSSVVPFLLLGDDDKSNDRIALIMSMIAQDDQALSNPSSILPFMLLSDGKADLKSLYLIMSSMRNQCMTPQQMSNTFLTYILLDNTDNSDTKVEYKVTTLAKIAMATSILWDSALLDPTSALFDVHRRTAEANLRPALERAAQSSGSTLKNVDIAFSQISSGRRRRSSGIPPGVDSTEMTCTAEYESTAASGDNSAALSLSSTIESACMSEVSNDIAAGNIVAVDASETPTVSSTTDIATIVDGSVIDDDSGSGDEDDDSRRRRDVLDEGRPTIATIQYTTSTQAPDDFGESAIFSEPSDNFIDVEIDIKSEEVVSQRRLRRSTEDAGLMDSFGSTLVLRISMASFSEDLMDVGSEAYVEVATSLQQALLDQLEDLESGIKINMLEIQFYPPTAHYEAQVIFTMEIDPKQVDEAMDAFGNAAVRMTGDEFDTLNSNGEFMLQGPGVPTFDSEFDKTATRRRRSTSGNTLIEPLLLMQLMTQQSDISSDYLLPLLLIDNTRKNNVLKFVLFNAMRGRMNDPTAFNMNLLLMMSLLEDDSSRSSGTEKQNLAILILAMQTMNPSGGLEAMSLLPILLMKQSGSSNVDLIVFMEISRQRNRQLCAPLANAPSSLSSSLTYNNYSPDGEHSHPILTAKLETPSDRLRKFLAKTPAEMSPLELAEYLAAH